MLVQVADEVLATLNSRFDDKDHRRSLAFCDDCVRTIYHPQPMPSLRQQLDELATQFAQGVMAAIRSASIAELHGDPKPPRGGSTPKKATKRSSGRLARRSAEEIETSLSYVLKLVRTSKRGMTAEEIRTTLGLERREVPRILKTGLRSKRLKSKGQKRWTRYLVG